MILGVFIILIAGWMIIWCIRRRRKQRQRSAIAKLPSPSPKEKALDELKKIKDSLSANFSQEFAYNLSRCLKTYISKIYKISAHRLTSEETITQLMKNPKNNWKEIGTIAEIFRLLDQVKFSGKLLSPAQQKGIIERTESYIMQSS